MKHQLLPLLVTCVTMLSSYVVSFAQPLNLRSADKYVLFTSTGAVGNTGVSNITGDIGTNNGAITGFELPTIHNGDIDSGNSITVQAAADVQAAYDQLFNRAPTSSSHAPAFGSGETLFAGVYAIAAAGSVAGTLTLDAQGDPNAVFIFKFGGAFTTGASTTINLINGATACNVFWGAEGAISMAASTTMSGTLIANNGAISMGAGGLLDGRMLSTTGEVSINGVTATAPLCAATLPVQLLSFSGNCSVQKTTLKWSTSTETNNDFFTVERSAKGIVWQTVGTISGAGNSSSVQTYTLTDQQPQELNRLYRIKQTDLDGKNKYSPVIVVKSCASDAPNQLTVYPNPSAGKVNLLFTGNTSQVGFMKIFNSHGKKIYESTGFQSSVDLTGEAPGLYILQVKHNEEIMNLKIMIKK